MKSNAQMRQVYLDNVADNQIYKTSFYSASTGYVAFRDWVGYTTDSGRTYTKKYITFSNVNFNGNSVNLTFGFGIKGVHAFNQNRIIVYGDYGFVPSILLSTDGGNTFLLVYHSQFNSFQLSSGIEDLVFPGNGSNGFAVDADRILRSTNQGSTWAVVFVDPLRFFTNIEAVDANNLVALSTNYTTNRAYKTSNGGSNWTQLNMPTLATGKIISTFFLTSANGWISMRDDNNSYCFYKTTNGGANWTLLNNPIATPFAASKMRFFDANIGIGLAGQNEVCKTVNGGVTWEPFPRDNNYTYLGYSHNDLQCLSTTQLWAGGGHGFLELNTNAAGATLPKAYFLIDTVGLGASGNVQLVNYSRTGYSYKWYLNNIQISTAYNATYTHDPSRTSDEIKLVVNNGSYSDSVIRTQYFNAQITVTGFNPTSAGIGNVVTITGTNFSEATSVSFGNVPAAGFTVINNNTISATVGIGASGSVRVASAFVQGSKSGFTYIPAPDVVSINPTASIAGNTITITGTNFINVSDVKFNGISAIGFTTISPTTITATVPSGSSGYVLVVTPGGRDSIAGYQALPKVNSFSPVVGTFGTILNISGSSFIGATAVSVGGTAATSLVVNSAGSITAVLGAGATGNVVVTKPEGVSALGTFGYRNAPVISTVVPLSGPVGTLVTISGTGFNAIPSANTVFFGAAQANVTSATATTLTVIVPAGCTYAPITVTNNNLTAFSSLPFLQTFTGGGSLTATSFTSNLIPINADDYLTSTAIKDIDGDGKNDLLVTLRPGGGLGDPFVVYRNTSVGNNLSFSDPQIIAAGTGYANLVLSHDMDGDGKPDIVAFKEGGFATFRNTSTAGNISFSAPVSVSFISYYGRAEIIDLDGDGKPDVYIAGKTVRNISEPGAIAYGTLTEAFPSAAGGEFCIADVDGDLRPDLIRSDGVYKNTSVLGAINFINAQTFSQGNFLSFASADVDNDGKLDLVIADYNASRIRIMKNMSTGATISFINSGEFVTPNTPVDVTVGDLDGDGKADIAYNLLNFKAAVLKNISSTGNINFAAQIGFAPGVYASASRIVVGDLSGDSKADIVTISELTHAITILKNEVKAEPFIISFSPTTGIAGTVVQITGANFTGATGVSFGGTAAASFTVNSATTITAIVGTGAGGAVTVTNNFGTGSLLQFVYGAIPIITSISPLTAAPQATAVITGSNFNTAAALNKVYFGGALASVVTASSTSLTVRVPFGSLHKEVSVSTNGLTAYSSDYFLTSAVIAPPALNALTFTNRIDFNPEIGPGFIFDMDNDGKVDIVGNGGGASTGISFCKNTSTSGNVSFAPTSILNNTSGNSLLPADFDGDGKTDIAGCLNDNLALYRNIGSTTAPSFGTSVIYPLASSSTLSSLLTINDFDGDGKPDVASVNYSTGTIGVFKNISTVGSIAMGTRIDFLLGNYGTSIGSADLDNDGKPEMIATSFNGLEIFRNTSTVGNIIFAAKQTVPGASGYFTTGDVDNDGKKDIVMVGAGLLRIFRNTTVGNTITFAAAVTFPVGTSDSFQQIDLNDFDSDGKPDVFITNFSTPNITVLKNNSTTGNIQFGLPITHPSLTTAFRAQSADIDGDAHPDLVEYVTGKVSIYRNNGNSGAPTVFSFTPVAATTGGLVTITGTNFTGVTSVSFGGVPASSFTIISPTVITATVASGATGTVTVTNTFGAGSLPGFTFSNSPIITSVNPLQGIAGSIITIIGANFTGVNTVTFGGTAVASFTVVNDQTITVTLGTGNSGNVNISNSNGVATFPGFDFLLPPTITSFTNNYGYINSAVTIIGTNFSGTTSVTFGGVAATSFTVTSPTTIVAVLGDGATGNIQVTNPAGTGTFAGYIYQTQPNVSAFYPLQGTTGTIVNITGTQLGTAQSVKFGGVDAQSFVVNSSNSITAVVGSGATGTVSVFGGINTGSLPGFTYLPGGMPNITAASPLIGGTGTVIIITGTNLNSVASVLFGGVAAQSFVVVSPTQINAVVGSGSSGNISVSNGTGTGLIAGFIFSSAPTITSLNPTKGIPGSIVTITGSNFGTTPANNTVWFGAVKATITAATATSLTVTVPVGATHSSVTVTANGLTGYSRSIFMPTFTGGGPLNNYSFASRTDYSGSTSEITLADLDGDGKPDINTALGTAGILIKRNLSNPGAFNYAAGLSVPSNNWPVSISYGDFDGDGKLDLNAGDARDGSTASVYKNTSTGAGNISFGQEILITPGLGDFTSRTVDLDGDGKPDVVALSYYSGLTFARNTTVGASVSFGTRQGIGTAGTPTRLSVADFDNDGKPDITVAGGTRLTILKNTSVPGIISFQVALTLPNAAGFTAIEVADFDNDGKTDIAFLENSPASLSIFKNLSVPGIIMLGQRSNFITTGLSGNLAAGDVNGDGRADIVMSSVSGNWVSVYSNNTGPSSTTISFLPKIDYPTSSYITRITLGDVDGDAKPEIILANGPSFSILKNLTVPGIVTIPVAVCSGANQQITSNILGTTYQWQVNTGTGFANVTNGINYSGTNTSTLQLINIPAIWTGYAFRCVVNGVDLSSQYNLILNIASTPSVTIATQTTNICFGSAVTFTATAVNGGTAPTYQWKVNGISVGTNASTYTSSTLTNGSLVTATLTSNAACASSSSIISNTITMVVGSTAAATIVISTPATQICPGQTVTFTSIVINGGPTPSYQWKVNGVNEGTNNALFITSALNNGDIVSCNLTGSSNCSSAQNANSNTITIAVVPSPAPSVSIVASQTNICSGTAVTFTATLTNGGPTPAYQWKVNNVNAGTNSPTFTTSSLQNNDQVTVVMTSSLACAAPATATSNSIVVAVTTSPIANAGNDVSICVGSSTQLTGSGGAAYSWSPITGINNASIANPIATPTTSTLYVLTVSNGSCTSLDTVRVIVQQITTPTVSINTASNNICSGSNATFTTVALNAGATPSYQWQVNGINAGTNSATFSSTSLQNNAQVKVIVTSSGCTTTPVVASNVITMSVTTLAQPIVSLNTNVLTVANTDAAAIYTWQALASTIWNNVTPTATGSTYTITQPGEYRVKAEKAACTLYSASLVSARANPFDSTLYYIYLNPNPARGVVTVNKIVPSQNWQSMEVINLQGATVLPSIDIRGLRTVSINVSTLAPGIYFIRLTNDAGKKLTYRFIKE